MVKLFYRIVKRSINSSKFRVIILFHILEFKKADQERKSNLSKIVSGKNQTDTVIKLQETHL